MSLIKIYNSYHCYMLYQKKLIQLTHLQTHFNFKDKILFISSKPFVTYNRLFLPILPVCKIGSSFLNYENCRKNWKKIGKNIT
jgi:hypothetical protein